MKRKRHTPETPWASFADVLSGVLFVFILTTCWFAYQLALATQEQKEQQEKLEKRKDEIEGAKKKASELVGLPNAWGALTRCLGEKKSMQPFPDPGDARVQLYLPGVEWFRTGEALLEGEQRAAAVEIRSCIQRVLSEEGLTNIYDATIFFEGHTDMLNLSRSLQERYPTNWELSAARAAAVLRVVMEDGEGSGDLSQMLESGKLQFLAVGMADSRPAWERLCEDLSAEDQPVCEALRRSEEILDPDERRGAQQSALLQHANLWSARNIDCSAGSTDPAGRSLSEMLTLWANRCPEGAFSNDDRRKLLRRVDLRIELRPRITPQEAGSP